MENATDALKLAFAVLVLVLALAVCMNMYNRALEVSDMIIAQVGSYDYGDFVEFVGELYMVLNPVMYFLYEKVVRRIRALKIKKAMKEEKSRGRRP